jgi:membrane protein required for colicin V production
MENVAAIDIVFAVVIVLMIVRCHARGFVKEIFTFAAIPVSLLIAFLTYSKAASMLREKLSLDVRFVPEVIAFAGMLFIALLVVKILQKVTVAVVKGVKIDWLDKLLGAVFGFIEGIIIVGIVLFIMDTEVLKNLSAKILNNSIFNDLLLPFIDSVTSEGLAKVETLTASVLPFSILKTEEKRV